MKLSNFLAAKAIISLASGIAFVIAPSAMMSLFGISPDPSGLFMGQILGAALIGIGLICWLDKSADHEALQGITLALFIGDTIGFIVILLGQLAGLMNVLGWVNALIWLLLVLGLGYFRFLKLSKS